jgi:uncharacterized membrane protein
VTSADSLFARLVALFFVTSVLGWCVDTLLRSVRRRRFSPIRAIPFSPLYGVVCLCLWAAPKAVGAAGWLLQFLVFGTFICTFEYVAGALILGVRGSRIWDYRDRYCHLNGHTDLFHFFLWGALGVLSYRWAIPLIARPLGLPARLQ